MPDDEDEEGDIYIYIYVVNDRTCVTSYNIVQYHNANVSPRC